MYEICIEMYIKISSDEQIYQNRNRDRNFQGFYSG
jgi:hypothetical protein